MKCPAWLAVILLAALWLTGCNSGSSGDVSSYATRSAPSAQLNIGLTEWSIETGPVQATAGEVTLHVTNAGGTRHDLVVHGSQGSWATPLLDPGETYELAITAAAGEQLELVCTVTGHHSQGMHAELPVGGR